MNFCIWGICARGCSTSHEVERGYNGLPPAQILQMQKFIVTYRGGNPLVCTKPHVAYPFLLRDAGHARGTLDVPNPDPVRPSGGYQLRGAVIEHGSLNGAIFPQIRADGRSVSNIKDANDSRARCHCQERLVPCKDKP